MFLDTYYKQFIAKAAIEFMKEIVRSDYEHGVINTDTDGSELAEAIEWQACCASLMAEKLAKSLEDRWHGNNTTFFDPQDQPDNGCGKIATSIDGLTNAIGDVAEKYFG